MADLAHVGSIDDLARFRANLVTFLSEARVAVEECASDVAREQSWLDHDRRSHWERETRHRERKLDEAKQELFRESLSAHRGPASFHQLQVHRAERSVMEAREKLARIRNWSRSFENRSLPLLKQIERLHSVLTIDLGKGVQFLDQTLQALDAYASRSAAPAPRPTAVGSERTSIPPGSGPEESSSIAPETNADSPAQPSSHVAALETRLPPTS